MRGDYFRVLPAALLFSLLPVLPAAFANAPAGSAMGTWQLSEPTPAGRWVTPTHDAVIQFSQCGTDLCGRIVGMILPPGAPVPTDWEGKTQCGLMIVQVSPGIDAAGNEIWTGSITDPRDGSVYHALLHLADPNDLALRGYVGLPLFGQTQTWTKFNGKIAAANCALNG